MSAYDPVRDSVLLMARFIARFIADFSDRRPGSLWR